MSALKEQLKLREKSGVFSNFRNEGEQRHSLLFSPSEAKEQSIEAVYDIGLQGLTALQELDARFAPFARTLFDPSAKSLAREMQTRETNESIDASVLSFMRLLTPYFLHECAHKAIEYLLRRYRVSVYNVPAVLECILPYHETKLFAKLVSTLRIPSNSEWAFLLVVKRTKVFLDTANIAQECIRTPALLTRICEMAKHAVPSPAGVTPTIPFYLATVIHIFESVPRITDELLLPVLPYIVAGIKSKTQRNYKLASYMLVTALASRITFKPNLQEVLVVAIASRATETTHFEALLCLTAITQAQRMTSLPAKASAALFVYPSFVLKLEELSRQFDTTVLMSLICDTLIGSCSDESRYNLLQDILRQGRKLHGLSSLVPNIVSKLIDMRQSGGESEARSSHLLRLVSSTYPSQLDTVLSDKLKTMKEENEDDDMEVDSQEKGLIDFVSTTFKGTRNQSVADSGTTLLVSLQHPKSRVRVAAIQEANKLIDEGSPDSDMLLQNLILRLSDSSTKVVSAALSSPALTTKAEARPVFDSLMEIIIRENPKPKVAALQAQSLQVLSALLQQRGSGLYLEVAQFCLGRIFISGSDSERALRRHILQFIATTLTAMESSDEELEESEDEKEKETEGEQAEGRNEKEESKSKSVFAILFRGLEGPVKKLLHKADSAAKEAKVNAAVLEVLGRNVVAHHEQLVKFFLSSLTSMNRRSIMTPVLVVESTVILNKALGLCEKDLISSAVAPSPSTKRKAKRSRIDAEDTGKNRAHVGASGSSDQQTAISLMRAIIRLVGFSEFITETMKNALQFDIATESIQDITNTCNQTHELVYANAVKHVLLFVGNVADAKAKRLLLDEVYKLCIRATSLKQVSWAFDKIFEAFNGSPLVFLTPHWTDGKDVLRVRNINLSNAYLQALLSTRFDNANVSLTTVTQQVQDLVPHIIIALSDKAASVRQAALLIIDTTRDLLQKIVLELGKRDNSKTNSTATNSSKKKRKSSGGSSIRDKDESANLALLSCLSKLATTVHSAKREISETCENFKLILRNLLSDEPEKTPTAKVSDNAVSTFKPAEKHVLISYLFSRAYVASGDDVASNSAVQMDPHVRVFLLQLLSRVTALEMGKLASAAFVDLHQKLMAGVDASAESEVSSSLSVTQHLEYQLLLSAFLKPAYSNTPLFASKQQQPTRGQNQKGGLDAITSALINTRVIARQNEPSSSLLSDTNPRIRRAKQFSTRLEVLHELSSDAGVALIIAMEENAKTNIIFTLLSVLTVTHEDNKQQQQQQQQQDTVTATTGPSRSAEPHALARRIISQAKLRVSVWLTILQMCSPVQQRGPLTDGPSASVAAMATNDQDKTNAEAGRKRRRSSNNSSSSVTDVASETPKRRRRDSNFETLVSSEESVTTQLGRLVLLLELMEPALKPLGASADTLTLAPQLCALLDYFVQRQSSSASTDNDETEYLKLLIVKCLTAIVQLQRADSDSGASDSGVTSRSVSVDTIIQTLRASTHPGLHNAVYHLLSHLGRVWRDPDQDLLSSVMPVFTYMGASAVRHDDTYTFDSLTQLMSVVLGGRGGGGRGKQAVPRSGYPKLISQFVDNIYNTPINRRVVLFSVLLQTAGLEHFQQVLTEVMLKHTLKDGGVPEILVDSETTKDDAMKQAGKINESLISFAQELAETLPIDAIYSNMSRILAALTEAEVPPTYSAKYKLKKGQIRAFQSHMVEFMLDHISSRPFLRNLLTVPTTLSPVVQKSGSVFFDTALNYSEAVVKRMTNASKKAAEDYSELAKNTYEIIERLGSFMTVPQFVKNITILLKHPSKQIRKRGLSLFNQKVIEQKTVISQTEGAVNTLDTSTKLFLDMTDPLMQLVQDKDSITDPVIKQMALSSLIILCRHFGKSQPKTFLTSAQVSVRALAHPSCAVVSSALVSVATHATELGPLVVPMIPKFAPVMQKILNRAFGVGPSSKADAEVTMSAIKKEDKKMVQRAAVSSIEAVLRSSGKFFTPYLPQLLATLLPIPAQQGCPRDVKHMIVSIHDLIGAMETRVVLPTIFSSYRVASDAGASTLKELVALLSTVISNMNQKDVETYYKPLFKFMEKLFDYRATNAFKSDMDDIELVEEAAIKSFISLSLKLNDSEFKPLLLRAIAWAVEGDFNVYRRTFLYRLVVALADKYKSLFLGFFGYILDDCVSILTTRRTPTAVLADFKKPEKGEGDKEQEEEEEEEDGSGKRNTQKNFVKHYSSMLCLMIDALHRLCLYDTGDREDLAGPFADKDKYLSIVSALVGQLENTVGSPQLYQARMMGHLIPALIQLAVTAADEKLWKDLNHQVCLTLQNESATVRFASLKVIQGWYTRLGEEYLTLLPETVPFLAELMEDAVPEVEHLCQQLIKQIDLFLGPGESITSYFH
eukprot:TRINITY_DN3518_c1_g1_i1.p1 TRINITY_DN3518_c1_g1~~TRINITY_DN3518_c1_g1_i1.p1  ORF type:complete len:2391 (+),score=459.57 TRINITY_DN3518_c1_g1_i1:152-7324(+)